MPQLAHAQKWVSDRSLRTHAGLRAVWLLPVALCVCLVLLRSWFFVVWEESYFDSDQAIVGLMAKHLVEGRALPLFFYGQEYMLAVEAWVAAPFIGLFGTSVASLRIALVAMNIAAGLLLWRLLVRDAGLSVWAAAAAASLFWIAPLATGSELVDALGGNIEPFLWVLIFWLLRRRPLALGACMALAFLNREFSIYAVPMLGLLDLYERRDQPRALVLDWLITVVGFLVVFTAIQLLKPHADLLGPASAGVPVETRGQGTLELLLQRVHWNPADIGRRFQVLFTDYLPTMLGFKEFNPSIVAIGTDLHVGEHLLTPFVALLAAAALLLLALDARSIARTDRCWFFPAYLIGIGLIAGAGYAITRPLSVYTIRYGMLTLYAPVGLAALALHPARRRLLRTTSLAVVALYAACSIVDYVRVLARAPAHPPAAPLRAIERRLAARGIEVALADYWRAYSVTFLSGERIKVDAVDFRRILEYWTLAGRRVEGKSREGVIIQREPCPTGGEKVGGQYLCDRK